MAHRILLEYEILMSLVSLANIFGQAGIGNFLLSPPWPVLKLTYYKVLHYFLNNCFGKQEGGADKNGPNPVMKILLSLAIISNLFTIEN